MLLTQLEYFVTLAREKHFGRAAAVCFVSQSALSESLHRLEQDLDVRLVHRARTFEGLTAEGEQLLIWARRIVADQHGLREAIASLRSGLTGTLRLGAVPSATTSAVKLTEQLSVQHPLIRVELITGLPSAEIARRIREFELDAGLLYVGDDNAELSCSLLHHEELRVVMTRTLARGRSRIRLVDLLDLPLALMTTAMRGRQVLDRAAQEESIELNPQVEADSVDALISFASAGQWMSVIPSAGELTLPAGLIDLPLGEPVLTVPLVFAVRAEEPVSMLARATLRVARVGHRP